MLKRSGECPVCGESGGRIATTESMRRVDRYVQNLPGHGSGSASGSSSGSGSNKSNGSPGGAHLLVFGTGHVYPLSKKKSRIGRDKTNEILIANDTCVSRHHSVIFFLDGNYWLEDMNSTNGTLLNGKAVRERRRLYPGDRIAVGKTELTFELALPSNELGSYDLTAQLGRGGMGVVYKARDQRNQRVVAIKQLNLDSVEPSRQKAKQERFKREASTASRLNHPNIVSVYSVEMVGDTYYYVMEYLEGHNLCRELELRGGHLSGEEFLPFLEQIAGALAYAHSQRIVHRDVKPANVFILNDGRVKLTDFGIAALLDVDQTKLTRSGSLLGTPAYVSPEQIQDPRQVDHRADIYSLGVLTYQALAGRLPFQAEGLAALAMKVVSEKEEPLDQVTPAVNPRTAAVVAKAMQKKAADRHPSALDYLWDFRRSLVPEPASGQVEEPPAATISQDKLAPAPSAAAPNVQPTAEQAALSEITPCPDAEQPLDVQMPGPASEQAAPGDREPGPASEQAAPGDREPCPAAEATPAETEPLATAPMVDSSGGADAEVGSSTGQLAAVEPPSTFPQSSPHDLQPEPVAYSSPDEPDFDVTIVSQPLVESLVKPIGAFGRFGRGSSCFIDPYAVCCGRDIVVVSDLATRAIQIFTSEGRWVANVKKRADAAPPVGSGKNTTRVVGLALNRDGEILACHSAEQTIQVADRNGELLRELPTSEWGEAGIAALGCDASGLMFAADALNGCVHVIDRDGRTPVGKIGRTKRLKLKVPACLYVDHRNQVFVVDIGTATISVFNQDGSLVRSFGGPQTPTGMLMVPTGIAVDKNDLVYVSDSLNNCVEVFSSSGEFLYSFGGTGTELGEFIQPAGLCIDHDAGVLYVADRGNHRIQMMELLAK